MKEDMIEEDIIVKTINILFETLDNFINDENKKNELDELSELIYIIVTNSYEKIKKFNNETAQNIFNNVTKIASTKVKECPGITNKCIFKHMDIVDELT